MAAIRQAVSSGPRPPVRLPADAMHSHFRIRRTLTYWALVRAGWPREDAGGRAVGEVAAHGEALAT